MVIKEDEADVDHAADSDSDWRVFKHDTEAGRLLARLYGVQPGGKPQINYPKLKARKNCSIEEKLHWKSPGQCRAERRGFDRSKAASVTVPKVGRAAAKEKAASVTRIPRRKQEGACHEDLASIESARHTFRPPHRNEYSTDREKDRLNEVFTFGGGAALPKELTLPEAPLPSEEERRRAEARRVERARRRRRARKNGDAAEVGAIPGDMSECDCDGNDAESGIGHKERLFDQILGEIEERRRFQFSMEEVGSGVSTREKIAEEISSRMKELVKLDRDRAAKIVCSFRE